MNLSASSRFACLLLFIALSGPPVGAGKHIDVQVRAQPPRIEVGGKGQLVLTINIPAPYHINAHPASFDYLIPSDIRLSPVGPLSFAEPRYPKGILVAAGGSSEPISVYEGRITISVPYRVSREAEPGRVLIQGIFSYQACDAVRCFLPEKDPFSAPLEITARAESDTGLDTGVASPEIPSGLSPDTHDQTEEIIKSANQADSPSQPVLYPALFILGTLLLLGLVFQRGNKRG
ncbi:MAG: hypothetical protein AAB229_03825 [Candidatus Hydrogenedentota bacterium]